MRKIIFVIITLAVALIGCAQGSELPPVEVVSVPSEAEEPSYESAEPVAVPDAPEIDLGAVSRDVYLDVLGSEMPWLTEGEMLDFAGLACDELDSGADPLTAAQNITGTRGQLDDLTAAGVVGGVIGSAYCENARG